VERSNNKWEKDKRKLASNDELVEEKKINREKVRRLETRNRGEKPCGIND
jgi:hypothetical protein